MTIDYSSSAWEIFKNVTSISLLGSHCLDYIVDTRRHRARSLPVGRVTGELNSCYPNEIALPSWVMDFSSMEETNRRIYPPGRTDISHFDAAKIGSLGFSEFQVTNDKILYHGARFDIVTLAKGGDKFDSWTHTDFTICDFYVAMAPNDIINSSRFEVFSKTCTLGRHEQDSYVFSPQVLLKNISTLLKTIFLYQYCRT